MVHHHQKSDSGSFAALSRHHEFYIQGGDLFFLVERHQFRVHRYFFERESGYFRGKLTVPASPGAQQQGTTESSSIILEDVTSDNFAKFLWVFYNPKYSLYNASVEDWSNILSLAHRWSFPEVKNLAVREMEKIDFPVIDRIVVYHANEVDRNFLIPRYAALCEREEPLTLPEGMSLGMETTLMIARAREYARAHPTASGARSPTVSNIHGNELHHIVRELFGITPPEQGEDEDSALPANTPGALQPLSPRIPVLKNILTPTSTVLTPTPTVRPTVTPNPPNPPQKKTEQPKGQAGKKFKTDTTQSQSKSKQEPLQQGKQKKQDPSKMDTPLTPSPTPPTEEAPLVEGGEAVDVETVASQESVNGTAQTVEDASPVNLFGDDPVQKPPAVIFKFDYSNPFEGDDSGDLGGFRAGSAFSAASAFL